MTYARSHTGGRLRLAVGMALLLGGLWALQHTGWLRPPSVATLAPSSVTYSVVSVQDGDTFTVQTPTGPQRVRILGINAPELAHDGNAAQCWGEQARAALKTLVAGHDVVLTPDPRSDDIDRYGRWLRYAQVSTIDDVGLELITAGAAQAYYPASEPAPARNDDYVHATETAKTAHVGMWASCESP